VSDKRTADGHAAAGLLVLCAEWYSVEQLLLSLMTFFKLELLHGSGEVGAVIGADGEAFSPGDAPLSLPSPSRGEETTEGARQFVGLEAGLVALFLQNGATGSAAAVSRLSQCERGGVRGVFKIIFGVREWNVFLANSITNSLTMVSQGQTARHPATALVSALDMALGRVPVAPFRKTVPPAG